MRNQPREAAPNHDRCGRCHRYHIRVRADHTRVFIGGNDHSCTVHGPVSPGCCRPSCDPTQWRRVPFTYTAAGEEWVGYRMESLPGADRTTEVRQIDGAAAWNPAERPTVHTTHVLTLPGDDRDHAYILRHERQSSGYWCGICRRSWSGGAEDAEAHLRQPHQTMPEPMPRSKRKAGRI